MNDDNIHTGICIVLPAAHFGSNELSHCTLAFLGNTDEVDYPKERAERAMRHIVDHWYDFCVSPKRQNGHILNWVERIDMFGVERDTPVGILTRGDKLMSIREKTVDVLESYDMEYSKMFEYTPHVSIQENIWGTPKLSQGNPVRLYRPTLWWGDDRPQIVRPMMVQNDHR